MPKTVALQTNFNAGIFSPTLAGRVDFDKYRNSLLQCDNAFLNVHGPVYRRPGFQYVGAANTVTNTGRLISFQVDTDSSVVIELVDQAAYFFAVVDGVAGTIDSGGFPISVVTPYADTDLEEIHYVQVGNVMYFAHPSYPPQQLTRNSLSSWTWAAVAFKPPGLYEAGAKPAGTLTLGATSGSAVTATTSALWLAADAGRLVYNPNGAGIGVITAYSTTSSVTINVLETFSSTTYTTQNWVIGGSPATTITTSGTELNQYVTVTAAAWAFRANELGSYIMVASGCIQIIGFSTSAIAVGVVRKALTSAASTSAWTIETTAWDATLGYPRTVAVHHQRLWFGGTASFPFTVWGSNVAQYTNFARGSDDSGGLDFQLSMEGSSEIQWMKSSRGLIIGSDATEGVLYGSNNGVITPTDVQYNTTTFFGGQRRSTASMESEAVFIQAGGRKVRAVSYNYENDSYNADDITFFADRLTDDGVKSIVYSHTPHPFMFALLNNGEVLSATINRSQNVLGWSKLTTNGLVKSLAVTNNGGVSYLWAIVTRTVDGNEVDYIEMMTPLQIVTDTTSFADSYLTYSVPKTITSITKANPAVVTSTAHGFLDGQTVILKDIEGMTEVDGLIFTVANKTANTFELSGIDSTNYSTFTSGVAHKRVTTISGLDHLEGEEVTVRADGAVQNTKTVDSGAITLDYAAGEVVVGLNYTTTIRTSNLETGSNGGVHQTNSQRWSNVVLRVYNSVHPSVNGFTTPIREPMDLMGAAPALSTGDLYYGALGWDRSGVLTMVVDEPAPFMLLGIFGSAEVNLR
jgi:hypothetical protein